jgi:hypothetical protein
MAPVNSPSCRCLTLPADSSPPVPFALGHPAYALALPRLSAVPGYLDSNPMRNIERPFDVHPGSGFISRVASPHEMISVFPEIVQDVYAAEISWMRCRPQLRINEQPTRRRGAGNQIGSNPVVVAFSKSTHAEPLKNAQRMDMLGDRITSADLQEGFLAP